MPYGTHLSRLSRLGLVGLVAMVGPAFGGSDMQPQLVLQARLFHSASASLSPNVIDGDPARLVNIVAGDDPSTATLVVVGVKPSAGAAMRSDATVRLTARALAARGLPARTLLDRSVPVGAAARGKATHLGFWLQGTGCQPVRLRAVLTTPSRSPAVETSATLDFSCGE